MSALKFENRCAFARNFISRKACKGRKVKRFFKSLQKRIKNSLYKTEADFAPLRETLSLAKHAKGAEKSKAPQAENRSNR
ncbi:MAG: hypothetical protein BWK80_53200, partial [Desulfobacteraceae bacterium IS3]